MAKRKRKQLDETAAVKEAGKDMDGGLKESTTNSHSAGGDKNGEGVSHFQIPFNDKHIICEKRYGTSSEDGNVSLIFTHGAGGGIENPATKDFVTGFANAAEHDALCFQGTMNLSHRTKAFHAVVEHEGGATALGGRSMGARAAVITATECDEEKRSEALILVSYPLSAGKTPKKQLDVDPRKQILLNLPSSIDVLFVVGSEDSMCDLAELETVRRDMAAKTWLIEVKGSDHGMSLKLKAGVRPVRLRTGALAAEWLKERPAAERNCSVSWDNDDAKVTFDGWQRKDSRESKPKKRKKK
jgi:predicted alpha/beta-hydrolase family hydrolase